RSSVGACAGRKERVRRRGCTKGGESAGAGFFALFGVLVEPGAEAFFGDLDDDVLLAQASLTGEARFGADVERLVHDVVFFVRDLGERIEAVVDPDVAGRACEVAAAGVTD